VKLKGQIDLLTKVMGRIHGGARGGGSIQMVESFKKSLTQERMDPDTLRNALTVERDWLSTYANPEQTTGTNIRPVGGGANGKEDLTKLSDAELLQRMATK